MRRGKNKQTNKQRNDINYEEIGISLQKKNKNKKHNIQNDDLYLI